MKREYDKKKRTIVIVLAVCAVCLAVGLYLTNMGRTETPERNVLEVGIKETQVTVPEIEIPAEEPSTEPENETPAETEPPAESGENAEVQEDAGEQEDIGDSAETTPESESTMEPPEVTDKEALTDHSHVPQYEPEVTQPEQKPEEPSGGSTNSAGQIYVPGFGYIDSPGTPQGSQADSNGDWDKQIGDMN